MPGVAAPLRVVRRPKGAVVASAAPPALVAASAPVLDTGEIFRHVGLGGRHSDWQAEAWQHVRAVGELGFYVRWRASSCSRVRLVASELDPDTGEPTGSIAEDNAEGREVAALVRGIAGGVLGQSQLIKRMSQVLTVQGEVWVGVLQRPDGERWIALTRREMRQGARRNSLVIRLPEGGTHDFEPSVDGLFRVWDPDAEDASLPTSPVQANLDPLREIRQATAKIRNADLSRLIGNGILALPAEASLPPSVAPVSEGKPGGDSGGVGSPRVAQELTQLIVAQAKIAVSEGEASMASLVPIVVSVPGDHVDKIRHIQFADQVTPVALQTRNDGIARLAMGLDMSPEQLLGLGSTSNHWSAFLLSDQDVQLHVAPSVQLICQAFYEHALRNALAERGIDPSRYTLWFDTSKLTADPDLTDEAKDAYEKGAITAEALVRLYGLPDDAMYDFTAVEGWRQWAQDAVRQRPELISTLLPLLDESLQAIDFPAPAAQALPVGDRVVSEDEPSGAAEGQEPKTEDNQQNSLIAASGDRGMSMALELMIGRAMELVGKRRVKTNDLSMRERLRGVDPRDYHRFMPPVADAQVAGLMRGWDTGLEELAVRYDFNVHHVRSVVEQRVRQQLTAKLVDA